MRLRANLRDASLLVVMAVVVAGCTKPASIAFEPSRPVVITKDKGAPIPTVVVKDEEGNELEGQKPALKLEGDVASLDEKLGKIMPVKNGATKLTATLGELPPATVEVKVQIIDELRVTCPEPCSVRLGETMPLAVEASGLGASLESEVEWTSSDPAVAIVEKGAIKGLAPGEATVTGKLGGKTATVKVAVRALVDEVRLVCPSPPLLAIGKAGGGTPVAADSACELIEGEELVFPVMLRAAGKPVKGERVEWASSDNAVVVSGGKVRADHAGGAVVEVKVGALTAEMPTSVYSAAKKRPPAQCTGQDDRYTTPVTTGGQLQSANGAAALSLQYTCESPASKKCVDDGIAQLRTAVKTLPLNDDDLAEYGQLVADERAKRCCCKR